MGLFRKAVVLTAMLLGTMQLEAQVVLPPIFNCNMVLQKGIEIPVWGWASPGEKVTVTFENHTAVAKAGKDGKWSVKLPAMNYGGPYNMVIKGKNLKSLAIALYPSFCKIIHISSHSFCGISYTQYSKPIDEPDVSCFWIISKMRLRSYIVSFSIIAGSLFTSWIADTLFN